MILRNCLKRDEYNKKCKSRLFLFLFTLMISFIVLSSNKVMANVSYFRATPNPAKQGDAITLEVGFNSSGYGNFSKVWRFHWYNPGSTQPDAITQGRIWNTTAMSGTYKVIVYYGAETHGSDGEETKTLSFSLYAPPTIVSNPQNVTVDEGSSASFSVGVTSGNPTVNLFQWQESTNNGSSWTDIGGATSNTYTIPSAALTMSGNKYRVLVGNAQYTGNGRIASSAATLTVNPAGPSINDSTALIMQWQIPANTQIKLPIAGTGNNYVINWGDGSTEQSGTTTFPTHTYTSAGTYTIKVGGTVKQFGYYDATNPGTTSNYYTFTQYIRKITQAGNLGYTRFGVSRCSNLNEINFTGGFSSNDISNMSNMFNGCSSLSSLNLSNFNTSSVTDMKYMFSSCTGLTTLNLSSFNTSKVTDMSDMFDGCSNLSTLNISNFDTSKVTNMLAMFYDCSKLTVLDLSNFNTASTINMGDMFNGCTRLNNLVLSNFNTSNVTNMANMFNNCSGLVSIDLSSFVTTSVTSFANMFSGCSSLLSLDVSHFNTSNLVYMLEMFNSCSSLTYLDLSGFNTTGVSNMSGVFTGCTNLVGLNISNFNTSNVTNMGYLFSDCRNLKELDLSNFVTTNVTNMECLFQNCQSLKELTLSNFRTSSVSSMYRMFLGCNSLKYLDISQLDTTAVTTMEDMFRTCSNLETLLLGSGFGKMNGPNMFNGCTKLKSIITLKSITASSQASTLATNTSLNSTAVLYVPNTASETYYEQATNYNSVFGANRIKPILEVKGSNPKSVNTGAVYGIAQDEGALVAGISAKVDPANIVFTKLGYSVTESGLPVNTSIAGNKTVTYTLKRGGSNVMTTTRTVTVNFVDSIAPIGVVKIQSKVVGNGGTEYIRHRSVTLRVNASDNVGATQIAIANENARNTISWNSFTYPTQDISWTLSPGDGNKTVYIMLKDAAGNTSVSFQS